MQKKNIKSTDFTLWEIEFEISKSYNRDDYSFDDAKKDFEEKLGVDILEEDDDEMSSDMCYLLRSNIMHVIVVMEAIL